MIPNFGFDIPAAARKDTKVVVAMSGGVDSSVVAALMTEAGFDVVGITLQLYDYGMAIQKKGACCAGQDIYDARQVADRLGIPHYVLDYESRFKESVMDDFADTYLQGATPIPCIRCNQEVKFADLLKTAKELGAQALATGHYVQRLVGPTGQAELHRATDLSRDQSYFLFTTTQDQLDFLRFPLGSLPKTAVRDHAKRFGLKVAEKPDSQDICFVPNGHYAQMVERLRPGAGRPGEIVHMDGTVLGHHQGIIHYTIGQRRGLGVGGQDDPLYVIRLEADTQRVVVGPYTALGRDQLFLQEVNWIGNPLALNTPAPVFVKMRSAQEVAPAQIVLHPDQTATVSLDQPHYGIAPGQACVFYQDNRVLGGGWIKQTSSS